VTRCADRYRLRIGDQADQRQPLPAVFAAPAKNRRFRGPRAPGRPRRGVCPAFTRKAVNLAQRIVEMLIGRLITDEQFRVEFLSDPQKTLFTLCDQGLELSGTEIAALVSTDPALWERTADAIDRRLQKASLKNANRGVV
jgi:hypothetical protein